jgi:hypothetical protein
VPIIRLQAFGHVFTLHLRQDRAGRSVRAWYCQVEEIAKTGDNIRRKTYGQQLSIQRGVVPHLEEENLVGEIKSRQLKIKAEVNTNRPLPILHPLRKVCDSFSIYKRINSILVSLGNENQQIEIDL